MIHVFTDGACSGNPGPGAWAALILFPEGRKELSGYVEKTTNNRMELMGVLEALFFLKNYEKFSSAVSDVSTDFSLQKNLFFTNCSAVPEQLHEHELKKESCKENLSVFGQPLTICSDSLYVVRGITQWIHQWIKNGWKTSQKKTVENQDLWKNLLSLVENENIDWQWVKGHSGHLENQWVDRLAVQTLKEGILKDKLK